MSSQLELCSFPEELLEAILAHCVIALPNQPPRPSWTRNLGSTTDSPASPPRGRLAVLLVCKKFHRISIPLYYNTINVQSPRQLNRLLVNALRPNPTLASHVRRVIFAGVWADGGELLRMANDSIRLLDVSIDTTQLAPNVPGQVRDLDAEEFCEGLKELSSLKHLIIRKPNNVYLTQPKPKYVLFAMAAAMHEWNELEYVDLAFRLSDDSGSMLNNFVPGFNAVATTSNPASPGSITALTQSLSTLPKLHTLSTVLPSMWNESILRVSANPALERIILGDRTCRDQGIFSNEQSTNHSILGTGLFFTEAKKHPRLSELIKAGTSIMRTRAHTIDMSRSRDIPSMVSQAQAQAQAQKQAAAAAAASKDRQAPLAGPSQIVGQSRARAVSTRC
ncbi:hypothetical protein D9613_012611 [Agrocybe pediades]|uniref:Uncharacterized protein n=1 Tax=Agrocybe pediades TaxID=84607 RepID=A0A8H4R1Q3_9AGAR|nr:hypothetical protein D9613_012611 [Agrocybe pediades]